MASFERTYSVVERSSQDSTLNEGTSYVRGYESSEILERRENEASINEENQPQGEPYKNPL